MIEYFNPQGIDTYNNPMQYDGQLIHGLNLVNFPFGALSKRPGYYEYYPQVDGNRVNSLFSFGLGNGTQLYTYRASGGLLYYSVQGTGSWQICGNGTLVDGNHVSNAILNNTMSIAEWQGSVRHTTNGTSFTDTPGAPVSQFVTQYHNRIYASGGTSSIITASSYGSVDNWSISAPADSYSFVVPNEGAVMKTFVAGDHLVIPKTKGNLFYWDDYNLVDMTSKAAPSSPWSLAQIDDTWFYLNQFGVFTFDGANRQLVSNPIQRQFYNSSLSGIPYQSWGSVSAITHYWDYLAAVGTVTDNFTGRTIPDAIIKYDFQKNQFLNWQFANPPTAWHSYRDYNDFPQLIFGDTNGHVYQLSTDTSDANTAIETEAVFVFSYAEQSNVFSQTSAQTQFGSSFEKKWDWIRLFFNPGNEVNIQFAFSNTFTYQHLRWSEAINTNKRTGDYWQESDGVVEIRFPNDPNNTPRSRFLFLRIYDDSDSSKWSYFGCQISADVMSIL